MYRLLCAEGMTQAEIAARTGQAQSEVSAIMSGRQVMSYSLLERIAAAFDIPRGRLGLAFDATTEQFTNQRLDEHDERDRVLAHAAKVTLGWPAFGEPADAPRIIEEIRTPSRVSPADVEQITALVDRLADVELRSGGGVVLPALQAQLRASRPLLEIATDNKLRHDLFSGVALLHRRASCAAFDMGLVDHARQHILHALDLAHQADQPELQASLFYSAGRMELYHGPAESALRLFQFGQPAALSSNLPRLRALLEINEARAYAKLGAADHAKRAMSSAIERFHEAADGDQPAWLRFFDSAELYGAAGIVWSALGDEQCAIAALRRSLGVRSEHAVLYRTFDLAELAACHVRNGDISEGTRMGAAAVEAATTLRSRRARLRLTPLFLATRRGSSEVRALHASIAALLRG